MLLRDGGTFGSAHKLVLESFSYKAAVELLMELPRLLCLVGLRLIMVVVYKVEGLLIVIELRIVSLLFIEVVHGVLGQIPVGVSVAAARKVQYILIALDQVAFDAQALLLKSSLLYSALLS